MQKICTKFSKLNCIISRRRQMSNIGFIVIGNEILNGQIKDENSHFLAESLSILGHKLRRISVIPDEIDIISKEVKRFSQEYDIVITSGGIGTTHDDVTFEAIALAFNESIHQHSELTTYLIKFFNIPADSISTDPRLKLAQIPESSKLIFSTDPVTDLKDLYPVVSNHNVYILPGIPILFKKAFNIVKNHLPGNPPNIYTKSIYFKIHESQLTDSLNKVVKQFSDSVLFGSYPVLYNNFYKVRISLESTDENLIESAINQLKSLIGEDNMARYDPFVFSKASENVYKLKCPKIASALEAMSKTFEKYQPNEVVVAFNGGKDCTVVLHLIHAYLQRNKPNAPMIRTLFVRTRPSFKEVEDFVERSISNYGIVPPKSNFLEYNGPIKTSLKLLKENHPEIKAIFMGTRKTDPNGDQPIFSTTTADWPQFVLVNPIINWNYNEIWSFLLDLSVPYCCLYDRGYTSLGGIDNTLPNPQLLFADSRGKFLYHPAYLLQDGASERIGR